MSFYLHTILHDLIAQIIIVVFPILFSRVLCILYAHKLPTPSRYLEGVVNY